MFDLDRRRVIFGDGALDGIANECLLLGARRVFLVYDPALPHLEGVLRSILEVRDVELVGSFCNIVPNPTVKSVAALGAKVAATA